MANFSWGGARAGAGRPRVEKPARVPHRPRTPFEEAPLHVTFRMAHKVYNLRSERAFNVLKRVFRVAATRFNTHIIHFAVLGNHIHLIVESMNKVELARAMKGLGGRIAKGLNRMMHRRGKVIDHRHHTRIIGSVFDARNVLRYVRENHRKHFDKPGRWNVGVSTDKFSSWAKVVQLPRAETLFLRIAEGFD